MTVNQSENGQQSAISASWSRCERKYRLARNTSRPILRLQSSEVAPRREELVERTGGHLGIFRQVADIAVRAGHCFSVADADGILVRREGRDAQQSDYESNGISLGSCWDERIAGTNGVSMAMAQQSAFTVRGHEHYFSKFAPFACTGAPLRDAGNGMIGVVNLAIVDRGNAADYQFAKQLLSTASNRIQRVLFERRFRDTMLVTVSPPTTGDVLRNNELLAVDESGLILGSTAAAHRLIGLAGPLDLVGQSFEDMFGTSASALDRAPERAPCVRTGDGQVVRLSRRLKDARSFPGHGWQPPGGRIRKPPRDDRIPSVQELASGSDAVLGQCNRAEQYLKRAIPFVVQGGSGSGKTSLVAALHASTEFEDDEILTVDCAVLGETDQDRAYVRTIFEQARIFGLLGNSDQRHLTLVFDNVDEMPGFAQAALRSLLQEAEAAREPISDSSGRSGVAVIATTRNPLVNAVQSGDFREDLYYLLANTIIDLPALPQREKLDVLVQSLAARLAGGTVEITPEALQAIRSYSWPGNVRELRSTLQQALLEGDGHRISLMDLTSSTLFERGARRSMGNESTEQPVHDVPYSERTRILDALIGARWNASQAARRLGIGRATIHRKMKQFGISRPT